MLVSASLRWPLEDGVVRPLHALVEAAWTEAPAGRFGARLQGDLSRLSGPLAAALLPGFVGEAARSLLREAGQRGDVVRFVLEADDSDLHLLPLEAMALEPGRMLGLQPGVEVVRRLPGEAPAGAIRGGPLRVLIMTSLPAAGGGSPDVDYDAQEGAILAALEGQRRAEAHFADEGTLRDLAQRLRDVGPHVLHLIAHGKIGALALEDGDGAPLDAAPEDVARTLEEGAIEGERTVRLVSLCACRSAVGAGASAQATPSVAAGLLRGRVPQVLGMQANVTDWAATLLFDAFYAELAEGKAPASALAAARRRLGGGGEDASGEWAIPALYEREGAPPLLDPAAPPAPLPIQRQEFEPGDVRYRPRGEFVGRRALRRELLRHLRRADGRHLVLHGFGGVGKSAFAAHLAERLALQDGHLCLPVFGELSAAVLQEKLMAAVGRWRLRDRDPARKGVLQEVHDALKREERDSDRWDVLAELLFARIPVVLLLDNFEDNLPSSAERAEVGAALPRPPVGDKPLAEILHRLLAAPGSELRVIVTSRFPFALGDRPPPASVREHLLEPLSWGDSRKLMLHLPALRAAFEEKGREAWRMTGGHPRALEYLDALLRDEDRAQWRALAPRLKEALASRLKVPLDAATWDKLASEVVARAAQDVFLDALLSRLDPPARAALDAFALYRLPVDRFGLQLVRGAPVDLPLLDRLEALTLLWREGRDHWQVHRLTAAALLAKRQDEAEQKQQHSRAARYWRHRNRNFPDGSLEHLLEALHHHWEAGEAEERHGLALALEDHLSLRGHMAQALDLANTTLQLARQAGQADWEAEAYNRLGAIWNHLGHMKEALSCHQSALAKFREIGDRRGEGAALGNLGLAYAALGDARKAIELYKQHLVIAREIGDRWGEGSALGNLGSAYYSLGDARKAIELYEQRLSIAQEIGDRRGEGNALNNLGLAYAALGDARKAIELYEQRLSIAQEIGDRRGEGNVLGNLGLAYAALGDAHKAIELYEQQLPIYREIGDRRGEGAALGNLGLAYAALGDARKAIELYEQTLVIAREIGDRQSEGNAIGNLGLTYAALGEARKAIELYEQHLVIAREIGDRRGEGNAIGNLGNAYADLGDARKAIELYEQYLVIAREIGDHRGEGYTLNNLGSTYAHLGDARKAIELYEQTLVIAREIGDRRGEGNALGNLGSAYAALGDLDQALALQRQAVGLSLLMEDTGGLPKALCQLASTHRRRESYPQAIALFLLAFQQLQQMGYASYVQKVRNNLGALFQQVGEARFREIEARVDDLIRPEIELAVRAYREAGGGAIPEASAQAPDISQLPSEALLEGLARAQAEMPSEELEQLRFAIAQILVDRGEPQAALPLLSESVAFERARSDAGGLMGSLHLLGLAHAKAADTDAARAAWAEALQIAEEKSHEPAIAALRELLAQLPAAG